MEAYSKTSHRADEYIGITIQMKLDEIGSMWQEKGHKVGRRYGSYLQISSLSYLLKTNINDLHPYAPEFTGEG